MPERFVFVPDDEYWRLLDKESSRMDWKGASLSVVWAFWGPLADELAERLNKKGAHWVLRTNSHDTFLEAIAEAVCQEAERRAQEKQG